MVSSSSCSANGTDSALTCPLARVVVGGMLTAPVLILLVLPSLYLLVHRFAEDRRGAASGPELNDQMND